jgi:hypothetical protein
MDFSHGNKGGSESSATDNLLMIEKYTRFFVTFMIFLHYSPTKIRVNPRPPNSSDGHFIGSLSQKMLLLSNIPTSPVAIRQDSQSGKSR